MALATITMVDAQGPLLSDAELTTLPREQAIRFLLNTGTPGELQDILRDIARSSVAADRRLRQAAFNVRENAARATREEIDAANQASDEQVNTLAEGAAILRERHNRDRVEKLIRHNDLIELTQEEERERLAEQIQQLMDKMRLVDLLAARSINAQRESRLNAAEVGVAQRQQTFSQLNGALEQLRNSAGDRRENLPLIGGGAA